MVAHWEVVEVEKGEVVASGSEPVTAATKPADVAAVMTVHDYKLVCPTYRLLSNGALCDGTHKSL